MLRALKTITFLYVPKEDRIAGAINAGHPDAWSCWLTRRLALAVLERAADYIASTSNLAQRAPAELRGEAIAFEREAAIAKTAPAMSQTPPEILKSSTVAAELADRLTIVREQDAFRLELRGQSGNGTAGVVKREELQRILQMLDGVVAQAGSAKMMMANQQIQGRSALAQQAVKFGWDHVHLRTSEPEAMAQWFESMLGAEVIRSMQQGKPRIDLKLGGANIFIAPVAPSDGVNAAPVTPYRGLDHFGLTVSGIDAVAAELKKKGVEFTREPTTVRPGVRICFIRGPEGVSIELLDRDPKY
jgi:catechol 2,3-dioxygenase-like lactoylglutathione lyase family enzyme